MRVCVFIGWRGGGFFLLLKMPFLCWLEVFVNSGESGSFEAIFDDFRIKTKFNLVLDYYKQLLEYIFLLDFFLL